MRLSKYDLKWMEDQAEYCRIHDPETWVCKFAPIWYTGDRVESTAGKIRKGTIVLVSPISVWILFDGLKRSQEWTKDAITRIEDQ